MNNRQERTIKAYWQVVYAVERLKLGGEAPAVLERLKDTLEEIAGQRKEQGLVKAAHAVGRVRTRLESIRKQQMLPLARLARRIFAGEPAMEAVLRVPHKRAPSEVLIESAMLMTKALRPHRKLLKDALVDPQRVVLLERETREVKKQFSAARGAVADRAVPTRRIDALMASAKLDVDVLDALVGAADQRMHAGLWKALRRVGKRMGRPLQKKAGKAESGVRREA